MRASYLEIYNEEIRDLLGSDTKQRLEVSLCCFNKLEYVFQAFIPIHFNDYCLHPLKGHVLKRKKI